MGEGYTVNSEHTKKFFHEHVDGLFEKEKYLTFTWRIGQDRSLTANSLFHVWATEYAAHLIDKNKKSVTEGEVEGMKRTLKREFWKETKHPWMIVEILNPRTKDAKVEFRSSAKYKTPEMFEFMCWIQAMGANDGVILESKGEHAKREREAMGK